jgi:hypothetical protein
MSGWKTGASRLSSSRGAIYEKPIARIGAGLMKKCLAPLLEQLGLERSDWIMQFLGVSAEGAGLTLD